MSDDTKPDSDLAEILAQFTNYIMNERVRAYNEGFDAGRRAVLRDPENYTFIHIGDARGGGGAGGSGGGVGGPANFKET